MMRMEVGVVAGGISQARLQFSYRQEKTGFERGRPFIPPWIGTSGPHFGG